VVCHGGGGISQVPDYWGNDYFDDHYFVNGEPKAFNGYCTDVFFDETIRFIEQNADQPFFCVLACNAPHAPYNVDAKYSDLYKDKVSHMERACFYGMISNIDENFARLESKLDDLGIAGNTILIFMTDNGTSMRDEDLYNAGLRGAKGSAYEGGHRVPFFLRWPNGNLLSPRDINTLTANIDLMPTLLDLCGIEFPSCDGVSLKPLLKQEHPDWPQRTIVTDSQRLPFPVKWRTSAVMTDRWRLINGAELYDIHADRGQRNDLSVQYPEIVDRLRMAYERWWELVSVQFEETVPISIGGPDNPVSLCAHDWRHPDDPHYTDPTVAEVNSYLVYDQSQVRKGMGENGYFEILVERAGRYRFELRRWPSEAGLPVTAGIEPTTQGWRSDVILERYHDKYSGGIALSYVQGGISIAGVERERAIEPGAESLSFDLDLAEGETQLRAWFSDSAGMVRGAYYVEATFME
jgi:hypothetical protein